MAPSSGFVLVPLAMRIARHALKRTTNLVRAKLAEASASRTLKNAELQPIFARNPPRQPLHPAAFLRQSKGRWYTTHSTVNAAVRRFTSSAGRQFQSGVKYDRASFPKSAVSAAVTRLPTRAPFASSLRPNLTGGALPRTAGGYGVGSGRVGGARYFSHTPAAPAQVVNNVSMAVRALYMSGQKTQFAGVDPVRKEKRFRTVSTFEQQLARKIQSLPLMIPGSFIDFEIPLAASKVNEQQEISAVLASLCLDASSRDVAVLCLDLVKLLDIGNFQCRLISPSILRVLFPGEDAESLERLCHELCIQRGIVGEDPEFEAYAGTAMALQFPFAASDTASECIDDVDSRKFPRAYWETMLSSPEDHSSDFDLISMQSIMSEVGVTGQNDLDAEAVHVDPTEQDHGVEAVQTSSGAPSIELTPSSAFSGYSSLHASEAEQDVSNDDGARLNSQDYEDAYQQYGELVRQRFSDSTRQYTGSSFGDVSEYEGMEGLLRFIQQCDDAGWSRP